MPYKVQLFRRLKNKLEDIGAAFRIIFKGEYPDDDEYWWG